MNKKRKIEILDDVYNLILNVDTKDSERIALITFKNEIEKGLDFDNSLKKLANNLRRIAIENLSKKQKLSSQVNQFYMKINDTGLFNKNLASGLIASGVVR